MTSETANHTAGGREKPAGLSVVRSFWNRSIPGAERRRPGARSHARPPARGRFAAAIARSSSAGGGGGASVGRPGPRWDELPPGVRAGHRCLLVQVYSPETGMRAACIINTYLASSRQRVSVIRARAVNDLLLTYLLNK